jgi:hypothetical protein
MTTPRRRLLAALAMVALIATGCSNGAADTGTTGGSDTSTKAKATAEDKGVKFSECIRAHGVPHFPDPDAKGDFNFGVDVTPAVWTKAVAACKALQPPGSLSSKRTPKEEAASLEFARCVRANGVKDFPDPVNGEPLINTYKIPSSNRPGGMAALDAAIQKCRSTLGRAAGGQR